jgi:hypothetical protein
MTRAPFMEGEPRRHLHALPLTDAVFLGFQTGTAEYL